MTRREMLKRTTLAIPLLAGTSAALSAEPARERKLGIGMHSYGFAWKAARDGQAGAKFTGALSFLEYAHRIGAAGVQVIIRPDEREDAPRIRSMAEALGMFFEGQLSVPKDDADLARFEIEVKTIRATGSTVARTAILGTRRYETLKSAAEFRDFKERGARSLTLAEPVLKKHGVRLAIENHKDYLAPELVEVLRNVSSEWVGACVDTGNSLALLEDPYAVVEALAPFAVTTHIKDMGVQEYVDGFLLSEVSIGDGFLDLPRMIATLRKANPRVALNLEMITRDPLQVPCLTPAYWATFGEMKAMQLAESLALVKQNSSSKPLPRTTGLSPAQQIELEDRHVRECLTRARQKLAG
ncbi:MAG TPA: sugar phosphate isomerase/epimerase family protein [Verrucomicrobiae bacterium]|jgi:sugar phosphate isomerase/epimerase